MSQASPFLNMKLVESLWPRGLPAGLSQGGEGAPLWLEREVVQGGQLLSTLPTLRVKVGGGGCWGGWGSQG